MARKRQHWNVQLGATWQPRDGYVLDRFARIACPYIFTYSIQKIFDPNLIHHRCIHCGQPMRGVESHASDFMMLTKFECYCIQRKTTNGIIPCYIKWISPNWFVERVSIIFERYSILTDYGANGKGAFYPNRDPQTDLICSAPNIYDLENGLTAYNPIGTIRRLSGESWHMRLPPKDFTGMTITDIKRWIKMIENFQ